MRAMPLSLIAEDNAMPPQMAMQLMFNQNTNSKMPGLIGKKIGMTSVFGADGKNIPCTVIEAGPCVVTQIRTEEKDGYAAVQLAYDDGELKLGDSLSVADVFKSEDTWVDVTGISKGKGFQGVVKRHGFGGVGGQTHGQDDRLRAPGSMGASSWPSRVFKGKRLAGRMGGDRVKILNLKVIKVIPESNLLLVKGSIPGATGSYVIVEE